MRSLAIDRPSVTDWYQRNRARTRAIFDLIDPSAYYSRPIALRNPIVFYEGHLPAFSIISFLRRGLGRPPVDARSRPPVPHRAALLDRARRVSGMDARN